MKVLPFIRISERPSDKRDLYEVGKTRLDRVSEKFYGVPYYGWLILLANPQFGGLEFNIKDQTVIRIPFPLNTVLEEYNRQVLIFDTIYGI